MTASEAALKELLAAVRDRDQKQWSSCGQTTEDAESRLFDAMQIAEAITKNL
jgi:hypothetical protein